MFYIYAMYLYDDTYLYESYSLIHYPYLVLKRLI